MAQARTRLLFASTLFTILLTGSMSAIAARPVSAPADIGNPNVSAATVQWALSGSYEGLILTVSGPNEFALRKEFAAGSQPALRVQDLGKGIPADGTYSWELTVVPRVSADVKRQLAAAREANDDATAERIRAQNGLNQPAVRSGAVTVLSGSFVTGGEEAPSPGERKIVTNSPTLKPVTNGQVIATDLIVQGSACIGLDCVSTESFGFDTIRMKENNLRIKFEDTSTTAGFPTHDWQLTANDSASGGAEKFSIEDITAATVPFTVRGSAPSNSIFVDGTGRVGFRTSTPVLDLHVSTGNTPGLRLDQTSVGGFAAQAWDVAANEANFFVRDVTNGSRLPFRIRPGAPTSSIDIAANGNVGIGGTASRNLSVRGIGSATMQVSDLNQGATASDGFQIQQVGVNTYLINEENGLLSFWTNANQRMTIDASGNVGIGTTSPTSPIEHSSGAKLTVGGVWQNASSRELKQDICEIDSQEARQAFLKLDPVKFTYKGDPQEHHAGFIAEDVPDLVAAKDRKSLSPMDIVAVLTKVVQDQQHMIDGLQRRLDQLEKKTN